ncbi:MAG TPA: hypothetical protein VK667_06955 [Ktedonobacteraceae bacterium]|jgi:hypothetical protein|nr:hypothetical protein [Ktedonobacteraceae bacterium]
MFRQITIHPPLPCVYHGCDGQATVAITYEISEHEWRMIPTCKRHTVPVPQKNDRLSDTAHHQLHIDT